MRWNPKTRFDVTRECFFQGSSRERFQILGIFSAGISDHGSSRDFFVREPTTDHHGKTSGGNRPSREFFPRELDTGIQGIFRAAFFGSIPEDFGNRGESTITKLPMRKKQWQKHREKDQTTANRMTVFCFVFFEVGTAVWPREFCHFVSKANSRGKIPVAIPRFLLRCFFCFFLRNRNRGMATGFLSLCFKSEFPW